MTINTSSTKVIGRSAIWSTLNQSLGQVMVLAVFLITARFISKEDFGTMATCLLVFEFFRQITVESVATTLLARKNPQQQDYNAAFILANVGSALSAILMIVLAAPIAGLMENPALEAGLQLTSIMLLILGLSKIHEVWLMRRMEFKNLALRSFLSISIGGAIGIYMAVKGYGLSSLITQQIVMSAVGTILLWFFTKWQPSFIINFLCLKEVFNFSRHIALNGALSVLGTQGNIFFSGYYIGPAAIGILNAANRLILALQMMTTSGLNFVALSALSQHGDTEESLRNGYIKCIKLTAVLTFPLFAGFGILSHDIVLVMLGEKWLDVANLLPFLVVPALIWSIAQYNDNIFLIRNKPHWRIWLTVLHALVNIALLFSVSHMGLAYIAMAATLKAVAFYPITTQLALNLINLKMRDIIKATRTVIISTLLMLFSVYTMKEFLVTEGWTNIIIIIPVGTASYGLFLFLLDKNFFKELHNLSREVLGKA